MFDFLKIDEIEQLKRFRFINGGEFFRIYPISLKEVSR